MPPQSLEPQLSRYCHAPRHCHRFSNAEEAEDTSQQDRVMRVLETDDSETEEA